MQAVKKLEIVADSVELRHILGLVDAAGATGYTVIREVAGKGSRGTRDADELTDVFKNCYVLVACDEAVARRIAEAVRPVLKRFGGLCLISDALYVVH